jgi:uncharacterized membrane protein
MIPVEAHLFLNHVPVVGLVFGLVFFVAGLKLSSESTLLAGLRIFVAMSIVVLLVVGSGLVAESSLENAAWFDADNLSRHRVAGILTLAVLVSLGGLSGAILIAFRNRPTSPAWATTSVLLLAITALGMSLWTGYLGGALRHDELRRNTFSRTIEPPPSIICRP